MKKCQLIRTIRKYIDCELLKIRVFVFSPLGNEITAIKTQKKSNNKLRVKGV